MFNDENEEFNGVNIIQLFYDIDKLSESYIMLLLKIILVTMIISIVGLPFIFSDNEVISSSMFHLIAFLIGMNVMGSMMIVMYLKKFSKLIMNIMGIID